jgi:hypothetical protein
MLIRLQLLELGESFSFFFFIPPGEEFRSAFARTLLTRTMVPGGSCVIDDHAYQVRNSDGAVVAFGSWLEMPPHE